MFRYLIFVLPLVATAANAQDRVRVVLRDDADQPVSYAMVALMGGGQPVVASDSGIAVLRTRAADSLHLRARRIGFRQFDGWVRRDPDGTYAITMPRAAATLASVQVNASGNATNTPLAQRGFYDRVDRVRKGAILGDLFTPELLDETPGFTKITQMVAASRYARVQSMPLDSERGGTRVLVIVGRGGCPMTVVLDGDVVKGTAQDFARGEIPRSMIPQGTDQFSRQTSMDAKISIDDVVDGRSVMAMEVYSNTANAPEELARLAGRGSCGIVALWTGSRR